MLFHFLPNSPRLLWNLDSKRELDIDFTTDGRFLVTCKLSEDPANRELPGPISFRDIRTGTVAKQIDEAGRRYRQILVSPDSKYGFSATLVEIGRFC